MAGVYGWFLRFRCEGLFQTINHHLVMADRERSGRQSSPSAAVIDSQSVKTVEADGPRGFDAGKKIKGRKRHAMVDTDGRTLVIQPHPAGIQDRDGAIPLLKASRKAFPFAETAFADSAYGAQRVRDATCIAIEVVKKIADQARLPRPTAPLGGRAHIRLDQSKPTTGKGLRRHHRLRRSLPIRRITHAAHTAIGQVKMSFESDS